MLINLDINNLSKEKKYENCFGKFKYLIRYPIIFILFYDKDKDYIDEVIKNA